MPTVYITAPSEAASDLARTLVDEHLAACVNLVECTSVFRWEGEVVADDEVILLAKTTDERYDDLVARVENLHPYEVPCIERFEETDVLESFAAWRADATRSDRD